MKSCNFSAGYIASVIFSLLVVPTIGQAATFHISPSGNNSSNGSFDQPWKTSIEGSAGDAWGIWDANRQLKFPLVETVTRDGQTTVSPARWSLDTDSRLTTTADTCVD